MTAPFGEALENALRESTQGGKLKVVAENVYNPRFFCCISGNYNIVGVDKDPVAQQVLEVTQASTADTKPAE